MSLPRISKPWPNEPLMQMVHRISHQTIRLWIGQSRNELFLNVRILSTISAISETRSLPQAGIST